MRGLAQLRRHFLFCGLKSDAQFAAWLLDALAAFVQAEATVHLASAMVSSKRERRDVIKGFVRGCTERISQRLDELRERSEVVATSNAKALVVTKDAAIKSKMDECGIKVRACYSSASIGDASSYGAGRAAGERASFGRPVSGRNATLRLK